MDEGTTFFKYANQLSDSTKLTPKTVEHWIESGCLLTIKV